MVQPSQMRASDDDRDRIAGVLRDAHAEGRLTQDELVDRLDSTYQARTYQELDRIVADLPLARSQGALARVRQQPISAPPPPPGPVRAKARRAARVSLNTAWWFWGIAVGINVVIWTILSIAEQNAQYPWPLWVAGPWGVVLLAGELAYRRGDARRPQG
ncbi:MAG TPA: DUF1707 domain-containing protein [Jiangellaceae bacterium]